MVSAGPKWMVLKDGGWKYWGWDLTRVSNTEAVMFLFSFLMNLFVQNEIFSFTIVYFTNIHRLDYEFVVNGNK